LDALRRAIRALEGRPETLDTAAGVLPFGIADIDRTLGGGLERAALHEIVAANETEAAAMTGFALALAGLLAPTGAVLWIAEEMAQQESGILYGPGLDEIGLRPDAVLLVSAAHPRDVLWAIEEALRHRAIGAVVGEIRKENAVDRVASRRLSLAATQARRPALLLRARREIKPVAAATRWLVGAAPSAGEPQSGPGPPSFAVRLERNRHGRLGSWTLEWNRAEHCFALAPAHSQPMAEPAADRPNPAAVA
jgi:protein ImuA